MNTMPQKILISSMRNPGKGKQPAISFCNSLLKPIIGCSFLCLKSPQYLTNIKSLIELMFLILTTLDMVCKRIGRTRWIFVSVPFSRQINLSVAHEKIIFKIEA